MADWQLIEEGLKRGYSLDEVTDIIAKEDGVDPSYARERGFDSPAILRRLGYVKPEEVKPEKGFIGNVLDQAAHGVKTAYQGLLSAPGIYAGNPDAERIAGTIQAEQSHEKPKEMREAEAAFADVSKRQSDFESVYGKDSGYMDSIGKIMDMLVTTGKEIVTNPKGMAYEMASQSGNMVAPMVGAYAGGKTGAVTGALLGPKGAVAGGVVGAGAGGFAGSHVMEQSGEFRGKVAERLSELGLEPTAENVSAIFQDKAWLDKTLEETRDKATGTAVTDGVLAAIGGFAVNAPIRAAQKTARAQLGATATAKQVSDAAADILASQPKWQKVAPHLKAGAIGWGGEPISEAAGQQYGYGHVDYGDVGMEAFAAAGEGIGSVYAAAKGMRTKPTLPANVTPPPSITSASSTDDAIKAFKDEVETVSPVPRGSFSGMDDLAGLIESERSDLGKRRGLLAQQQQEARDMEAEFSGLVKDEQIDQSYRLNDAQKQRDAERTRDGSYDLALQQREEQQGRTVEQLSAASEAQGFGDAEPTAMQLAMQRAQQKALDNEFSGLLKQERASLNEMRANVKRVAGVPVEQISTPQLEEIAQSEAHPNTKMAAVAALNDRHDAIQQERERLMQLRETRLEKQSNQPEQGAQHGAESHGTDGQVATPSVAGGGANVSGGGFDAAMVAADRGMRETASAGAAVSSGGQVGAVPVADQPTNVRALTENGKPSASWVIRNKETGESLFETFDRKKVDALNTEKYEAVPILEYLQSLNKPRAESPNDAQIVNVRQHTTRRKPASNTIAQAIINLGGISTSLKTDILGDASIKTRPGLFTTNGTGDLGEIAAMLSSGFGFSQIDLNDPTDNSGAKQLADLIARSVNGETILNEEGMILAQQAEEEAMHREDINNKAREFGIKPSGKGRQFSKVEAEVLKLVEMRLEKEIYRAGEEMQAAREFALKYFTQEEVDAICDKAVDQLGSDASILEIYQGITKAIYEAINENKGRNRDRAANSEADGIDRESRRSGLPEAEDRRPAGEGEGAAREGQGAEVTPEFGLIGQTEEEAIAEEQARRDEDQRKADEDRAEKRRIDAEAVARRNEQNANTVASDNFQLGQSSQEVRRMVHSGMVDMFGNPTTEADDGNPARKMDEAARQAANISDDHANIPNMDGVRAAAQQILDAIEQDDLADYGLRVIPGEFEGDIAVGDVLPPSRVWEDGRETDDELLGTSTVEVGSLTLDGVLKSLNGLGAAGKPGPNGYYFGDRVVLVKGDRVSGGDDSGESLLKNASVVGVWRKASKGLSSILPNEAVAPTEGPAGETTAMFTPDGRTTVAADRGLSNNSEESVDKESQKIDKDPIAAVKATLDAAGVTGTDRTSTIAAVRRGDLTPEDVAEAHPSPNVADSASEGKPIRPYATPDERNEAIWTLQAEAKSSGLEYSNESIKDAAEFGAPANEIAAAIDAGEDAVADLAERYAKRSNGLRQGFGQGNNDNALRENMKPPSEHEKRIASLTGHGLYELTEAQRSSLLKFAKVRSIDAFEEIAFSARREIIGRWLDMNPAVDKRSSDVAMFNAKSGSIGNPIDTATLESTIASVIAASPSQWSRDTVVTATLFADLPAPIVEKAKAEGYDAHGRNRDGQKLTGVAYDGKVYLVQENISSEIEAEETLLHERIHQILHGNAEDENGKALRQSLGRLYSRIGGKDAIVSLAKRVGADLSGPLAALPRVAMRNRPAFLVDEFLAHVEGQRAYEKFPQSVVRAIREFYGEFRDWLRSSKFVKIAEAVGVNLDNFTQSDLSWTLKKIRQQQAGTGSKAIRFMTAWHGSPHDHDGFDSSKIGTGEGAQAYGYGHYFASRKQVAEYYRDMLSGKSSVRSDNDYPPISDREWARDIALDLPDYGKLNMVERINRGKYDEAFKSDAEKQATIDWVNGDKNKGRLYQVELAPEQDEYLDWDKPLSEQSEKVREALIRAGVIVDGKYGDGFGATPMFPGWSTFTGESIHRRIVNHEFEKQREVTAAARKRAEQAASKYLHSIGIRGIKYLDGSSRPSIWKYDVDVFGSSGSLLKQHRVRTKAEADDIVADAEASGRTAKVKQIQQPDDQNHNYVIFDDADVKITAKESRRASNETAPANAGVSVSAPSESVRRIQAVVERFKSQFKGTSALDIRVVSTTFDIPARFRPSPFAEGVFHDDAGLVYLVTMNLRNPRGVLSENRAWQVLLHESVGHYGLSQMMGDKFASILKAVKQATHTKGRVTDDSSDTFKPGDKDYATWDAVKLRYPKASDAEIAQEVLARMAETDPGSSIVGYAVAVVRQWVREMARAMGINLAVSTSELRDLVAKASGYMRRGDNLAEERVPSGLVAASQKVGAGETAFNLVDVTSAAFKKWFGDSKVVDAYGKPLVVYHGTPKVGFTEFGTNNVGAFFSDRFDIAASYAGRYNEVEFDGEGAYTEDGTNQGVYETYLSIKNPLVVDWGGKLFADGPDGLRTDDIAARAKREGYDGLVIENVADVGPISPGIVEDNGVGRVYVAFSPTQIKSAISNTGEFNDTNPSILESRARPGTNEAIWDAPDPTTADNVIYTLQDKHIDLKRVQQAIKEAVGEIRDDIDTYLQEELFHGRAAKITEEFLDKEVNPLISLMRASNVSMEELETFLWARHAKERNAQIAKINEAMPDGGSGLTNKQADDIMAGKDVKIGDKTIAGVKPARKKLLSDLAGRVDAITRGNRALLERYSLESADTLNAWDGAYKHYVPLHREDAESHLAGMGTGQGYSVKGSSSKRATGSSRPVENILANLALQRERIITRGEKNRVAQSLYGLAKEMPNADLWEVDVKPTMRTTAMIGGREQVVDAIDPAFRSKPNVVFARFNGEDRFVVFNEHNERALRMAEALKNLDADDISHLLGEVSRWTRYFASINTQYNPIFGVTNLVRDVQTGLLNLKSTPIAGKQKEMMGHLVQALPAVFKALRAGRKGQAATGTWAQLWEEFQEIGGQTGYRNMFRNGQERAEALQNALDPTWWQKTWWGKAATVGGVLAVPEQAFLDKFGKPFMELLSDYNTMMENGIRLSAYKVALDSGMTKERAASLAKNLTVNFNRKGQAARQVGSLYAFFNASVQGTARMAETLNHGAKPGELLGKAGKQIVYGGLLLGAVQAMLLMAAGFDDEEPPEFVRDRNIIIPTGNGKYVSIPMPLGFHVLPAISRISIEFTAGGFKKPGEHLVHIMDVLLDSFNPIGNAGLSMQTVAPTVLDPIAALTENKDWSGRQIARQDFSKLNPTPGYTRAKDTASSLSRGLAYAFNYLSGGGEYGIGIVSPTPDQIDYLLGQLTGGVGRELGKVLTTGEAMATGEDLPPHKIPLVGRFYGDTTGQSSEASKFYGTLEKLSEHRGTLDRMKDARDAEAYREYAKEHPESRLYARAARVQRELASLRKLKRKMIERNADRAKVRQIEDRMRTLMTRFNQSVSEQKGDH